MKICEIEQNEIFPPNQRSEKNSSKEKSRKSVKKTKPLKNGRFNVPFKVK
jgi:hypothetical protein